MGQIPALGHIETRAMQAWRGAILCGASFAIVLCVASTAQASYVNKSPITAYWANLGPRPLQDVLYFHGKAHPAGVQFYRLGVGTVPSYSLSLESHPQPGVQLEGIDPVSSAINGLPQATYLAGCSSKHKTAGPLRPQEAAAYQVAIWHFTDDVPLSKRTVPNGAIRAQASTLASRAEHAVASRDQKSYCEPVKLPEGVSGAAWGAKINVVTGGQSVSDQDVNITLGTGSENQYPSGSQVLEVRINGVPAFVCTGMRNVVKTSHEVNLPVKTPCGKDHGPAQRQYRVDATSIGGLRRYSQATISLPRRDYPQQIEVLWNSESEAGAVYISPDGSEPIITAGIAAPDVVETITVQPANLSDFGFYLQRTLLAWIASLGAWGLIPLGLIVLILISAPVWFLGACRTSFKWLRERLR